MRSGDQAEPLVAPVWDAVRECTRRILREANDRRRRGARHGEAHVLHLTGDHDD